MPEPVTALDTTVFIDHGTFDLLDDGGPQRAVVDFTDPARWLIAGDNAVTVRSAAAWEHVSVLRLELWDGPPAPQDGWADRQEGTVRFETSSRLRGAAIVAVARPTGVVDGGCGRPTGAGGFVPLSADAYQPASRGLRRAL